MHVKPLLMVVSPKKVSIVRMGNPVEPVAFSMDGFLASWYEYGGRFVAINKNKSLYAASVKNPQNGKFFNFIDAHLIDGNPKARQLGFVRDDAPGIITLITDRFAGRSDIASFEGLIEILKWSPDGNLIACAVEKPDATTSVFVIQPSINGNQATICSLPSNQRVRNIFWSSSETRIAVVSENLVFKRDLIQVFDLIDRKQITKFEDEIFWIQFRGTNVVGIRQGLDRSPVRVILTPDGKVIDEAEYLLNIGLYSGIDWADITPSGLLILAVAAGNKYYLCVSDTDRVGPVMEIKQSAKCFWQPRIFESLKS